MMRTEIIRPYLERLLADWLQTDQVRRDGNGRYGIRTGTGGFYVELLEFSKPMVRVWSPVVVGVKKSAKLLDGVNQLNEEAVALRAFYTGNQIIVAAELSAETLDPSELESICNDVSGFAENLGPQLAERYNGSTMFPAEDPPAAANDVRAPGYL